MGLFSFYLLLDTFCKTFSTEYNSSEAILFSKWTQNLFHPCCHSSAFFYVQRCLWQNFYLRTAGQWPIWNTQGLLWYKYYSEAEEHFNIKISILFLPLMQILRQETGKGHVKHIYSQPKQILVKHLSKFRKRSESYRRRNSRYTAL